MDQFEKQQFPTSEVQIEKTEKLESERKRQRQTIIRSVADDKRSIDSTIESRTRTVQQIFSALERRPVERAETPSERMVENPEGIMDKVMADISRLEHLTIDDISRVLITSRLEVRDIESWLTTNKNEVQSLVSRKGSLETRSNELSAQLAEEEQKNFFTRLFCRKERQAVSSQLRETIYSIAQIDSLLKERQSRVSQVESAMQEFSARQQELALNAAEQLFQSVIERYKQLKEKLTSPAVKQELNEDLITRRILPELEKLQAEIRITGVEAEEYIVLLKTQLAEGSQPNWNDPIEKKRRLTYEENV